MILTYKYRIKDGTVGKRLDRHSRACNFVWNYCCQIQREAQSRWVAGRAVRRVRAFFIKNTMLPVREKRRRGHCAVKEHLVSDCHLTRAFNTPAFGALPQAPPLPWRSYLVRGIHLGGQASIVRTRWRRFDSFRLGPLPDRSNTGSIN
jgi:hypothetical protein